VIQLSDSTATTKQSRIPVLTVGKQYQAATTVVWPGALFARSDLECGGRAGAATPLSGGGCGWGFPSGSGVRKRRGAPLPAAVQDTLARSWVCLPQRTEPFNVLERDSVSRSNVDARKPSRISTSSGLAKLLRVTDRRSGPGRADLPVCQLMASPARTAAQQRRPTNYPKGIGSFSPALERGKF
jgi:hypothetical protein